MYSQSVLIVSPEKPVIISVNIVASYEIMPYGLYYFHVIREGMLPVSKPPVCGRHPIEAADVSFGQTFEFCYHLQAHHRPYREGEAR